MKPIRFEELCLDDAGRVPLKTRSKTFQTKKAVVVPSQVKASHAAHGLFACDISPHNGQTGVDCWPAFEVPVESVRRTAVD